MGRVAESSGGCHIHKESDIELTHLSFSLSLSIFLQTATLVTLNSPGSLQALHTHTVPRSLNVNQRVERACLMREVGLKCIGFVGIPKVINQLAALRAAVDEDEELKNALPNEPRRCVGIQNVPERNAMAYALFPYPSVLLERLLERILNQYRRLLTICGTTSTLHSLIN